MSKKNQIASVTPVVLAEMEAVAPVVEMPVAEEEVVAPTVEAEAPTVEEVVVEGEATTDESASNGKECVIEDGPIVVGRNTLPNYRINSFWLKFLFEKDQRITPTEARAKVTEALESYYDTKVPDKMPGISNKLLKDKIVAQGEELEKRTTELAEKKALIAELMSKLAETDNQ